MKTLLAAQFTCLALVFSLLFLSFSASAASPGHARYYKKGALHRPLYKTYKPARRGSFFQKH